MKEVINACVLDMAAFEPLSLEERSEFTDGWLEANDAIKEKRIAYIRGISPHANGWNARMKSFVDAEQAEENFDERH